LERLIETTGLSVCYQTRAGLVKALSSVDLQINTHEFLALVGESGCGKTTLGLAMIGLLPPRSARITGGSIDYKGTDLAGLGQEALKNYRGSEIAMIFQEPLTSLNPLRRAGNQIAEAIVLRRERKEGRKGGIGETMQRAYDSRRGGAPQRLPRFGKKLPRDLELEVTELLRLVRIPDPEQVIDRYPFELSGGMRQRVMIAMALSQQPALLIADEPTTALDVTTQAQVLRLMKEIKDHLGTTILLITHDLAVASQVADRVVVMYAGRVVEDSNVFDLFSSPMHPYTQGLLSCIPRGTRLDSELVPIRGSIPDLRLEGGNCMFHPRCPYAMKICSEKEPVLLPAKKDHEVACFLYDK
jgi:oligopeptide/dipeptide ABC transporter ATP-binding protein